MKFARRAPEMGMGQVRYYLAPPDLLKPEEPPERWGLLEWDGRRIVVKQEPQVFESRNDHREIGVLVSCLRRLGVPEHHGVSVRTYNHDLYPDPIRPKRRATLGICRDDEREALNEEVA